MKCNRCNCEMRIWQNMQTGQQMASCDNCKYDMPLNQPTYYAAPRTNSAMSIWAFILSLLCCFPFVGLILSIIDLASGDKSKKHGLSIAALVLSILWIFIGLVGLLTDTDTSKSSNDKQEVQEVMSDTEEDSDIENSVKFTEPESKPEPELSKEDFIAQCQAPDYKDLARYPDEHVGDKVVLTVQISQVLQGGWFDSNQYYRVYTDNDGYGYYYSDEYFMYDMRMDDDTRLLESDIIKIYGEYAGLQEVERALTGTTEYVPAIEAYYIEIIE